MPTSGSGPVDGVAGALLVATDLPSGMQPQGVHDATDFDIDAASYAANGGLDKADQTWQAGVVDATQHVVVVFDFRMLFPDADAAHAYLEAAEPILGETISGITPQADPPAIGDETRLYAGSLTSGTVKVDVQDLLFRVGPVVAKVYVGGFGTTISDAAPIAQTAAGRITALLAAAPAGSPVASAAASEGPVLTAAPAGSTLHQWAIEAVASSEYGATDYSAERATGPATITESKDDPNAWAPLAADGTSDWIELTYAQAVEPSAVTIHETYGNGAVILVEAFDPTSGKWVGLWAGHDPSPEGVAAFSPKLLPVTVATDRLRITLGDIVPGWSEIDAVELVGTVP